ncbi:hypothetical protein ACIB24_02145 [Spongisporangium articulatum]|uniref:Uncharacterized protein n=1 Tax=Spongisporangium articulatum TaxID=3362603 RepID=A0ABW8AHM1_9ACTN
MTGPETDQPVGDLAEWSRYFDQLEIAMHDFEAALAQRDVTPLAEIAVPFGAPPEALRDRWAADYARLGELEFRALALREDLRAEFSRLHGPRRPDGYGGYGSSIDISG